MLRAAGRLARPVEDGLAAIARAPGSGLNFVILSRSRYVPAAKKTNWHEISVSGRQIGEKMQKELTARALPRLRAGRKCRGKRPNQHLIGTFKIPIRYQHQALIPFPREPRK
ncbi:hypothetical protein PSAC2689_30508 [Paraburkholderia sacchari]|uniref:hypothetical protein n=1 Tax=Paraburkholderia sacchari TaxID=159450 RepID=UPI0039A55D8D